MDAPKSYRSKPGNRFIGRIFTGLILNFKLRADQAILGAMGMPIFAVRAGHPRPAKQVEQMSPTPGAKVFPSPAGVHFFILLLTLAPLSAWAWGDEGHRAIGAMADQLIAGTAAAGNVHALLGDETLSAASVWADAVKGRTNQTEEMIEFKKSNPDHAVHHYTDIPFGGRKYGEDSLGATNVDVMHAIPACILILQGRTEAQTMFKNVSPRMALRLLAHYIEDIHQPLHVGAGYLDKTKFVDPNDYPGHYGD